MHPSGIDDNGLTPLMRAFNEWNFALAVELTTAATVEEVAYQVPPLMSTNASSPMAGYTVLHVAANRLSSKKHANYRNHQ